ncbi:MULTISPECIES: DMT family transporter [unclassified Mesorhizobium]|nr:MULTISPECIES: DMT family transporter [unclassified Mesorhizobium]MBZ9917357.1 DMT family transporter [Mesorhizobium sp. BR1-1-7]MBZ9954846.1 DMT family transporter [Mesorhizobium sp. BR1-1-15]MBZ9959993.1 DMT family transporter [Mesorhizobium sp. BR1-1-14]MBZ9970953.1 DMT family transporter [Mesorhizobium sp. BR1-1-12]MBZ9998837.1 DMT family transporter [Mesorhizobium sp. B264B2A]MCA0005382.1 DMT family transporter [Mesorhizobium sp. B264B1B]MCA0017115.1 DMT family transporter [Mesorhizob
METGGVLAAILSSAFGGTAVGATRYLARSLDPLTIGAIRFGGGFLVLAAVALLRRDKWPAKSDWPGAAALGLLFFGLFPVLFNGALVYTTAARGALALSTLPVLTMLAGAVLGIEPPTTRKIVGVLVAMAGVAVALGSSLTTAPQGAWRGDLLMIAAAFCMALYNVWSRPFLTRCAPTSFAAFGMAVGTACLLALSTLTGGLTRLAALEASQWVASGYLAVICGALIFFLWAFALERAPPTLVAVSVAVNPVTASIFGAVFLGEQINANLIVGLIAVLAGIAIASGAAGRFAVGRRGGRRRLP